MPASRNVIIYGYWLLSSDLRKTSWMFLHGTVCPKTGPILSRNVVHFVLKPGPFCPGTWSVLSSPFCPWSVLSEYLTRAKMKIIYEDKRS